MSPRDLDVGGMKMWEWTEADDDYSEKSYYGRKSIPFNDASFSSVASTADIVVVVTLGVIFNFSISCFRLIAALGRTLGNNVIMGARQNMAIAESSIKIK